MNPRLDIHPGELFLFANESASTIYEYIGEKRNKDLVFVEKGTGSRTRKLSRDQYIDMRTARGKLIRVSLARKSADQADEGPHLAQEIDPLLSLDENGPNLTARQRDNILKLKREYERARTLRYYVMRHDETPEAGLSELALSQFVAGQANKAVLEGLEWRPSGSTLRRAIHECGTPGHRPLTAFLKRPRKSNGKYWHAKTVELKREMIAKYWSKQRPRITDAQTFFYAQFDEMKKELESGSTEPIVRPTSETLRLWIKDAEDFENYAARNGFKAAQRRFKGQVGAITATRALEYVMFDDTRADNWVDVRDGDDESLTEERPWLVLAVDVFSRMILGAVLTFDPPSIVSVVECLKQVVRPKSFLPDHLKGYKGADDGWGKPHSIIVDNAWQYASPSFQIMCEAIGINVIWAPVKNPEYKCHVEHAFHLLNINFWHRLPSGIPHKPHVMAKLRLNPRSKAKRPLDPTFALLWDVIVSIIHVETNDGIGMAPARAFNQSICEHKRPMLDDVASLDRLLGRARECVLTTSGIALDGERFHDPAGTTELLIDMLRFAKARDQRTAPHSTGKARVLVTVDDADCGQIVVWNAYRRRNRILPNIQPSFANGLPWRTAKKARKLAELDNLAYHSEEEKCAVRDRVLRSFTSELADLPYKDARKAIRDQQRHLRLVQGDTVVTTVVEPSATGMNDLPVGIAAHERSDDRRPGKAPRRGGKKASRKAARSQAKARERLHAKGLTPLSDQSDSVQQRSVRMRESEDEELSASDAKALLERLRANLR